jgi:hypothetical protein
MYKPFVLLAIVLAPAACSIAPTASVPDRASVDYLSSRSASSRSAVARNAYRRPAPPAAPALPAEALPADVEQVDVTDFKGERGQCQDLTRPGSRIVVARRCRPIDEEALADQLNQVRRDQETLDRLARDRENQRRSGSF